MLVICPNCSTGNPDDARYCRACGVVLKYWKGDSENRGDGDKAKGEDLLALLQSLVNFMKL